MKWNMDLGNDKLLVYLKEVELAAEDVLSDKQEIVDLDRKRNLNREALRAIDKSCKAHWQGDASKTWLALGNSFLKVPSKTAIAMLEEDQVKLDSEINILRSEIKVKVNTLREKQGQEQVLGLGIKALSTEEMRAVLGSGRSGK